MTVTDTVSSFAHDAAVAADSRVVDQRKRLDARRGADSRIPYHAVRADLDAIADFNHPLEHAVDVDGHVFAALQFATHVDTQWVGERYPRVEQACRRPLLIQPLTPRISQRSRGKHASIVTPSFNASATTSVR